MTRIKRMTADLIRADPQPSASSAFYSVQLKSHLALRGCYGRWFILELAGERAARRSQTHAAL